MAGSMHDRMIRIDCTASKVTLWGVPEALKEYVGGMGYGTKMLVDEVNPGIDPLSPENKIVLTIGPLTGTSAPMFPQSCIVTKSPLSGTILNSYAGGFLGAEIKFCGIDGIIFEGAFPEWTIVLIEDNNVRFYPADPVMGKSTRETEMYMKDTFGEDVRTVSIGKAGEKKVAMASTFSETRTFGRGGTGAVFGSKKIKGIAVRGTHPVNVADPGTFKELVAGNMGILKNACSEEYNLVGLFSRVGTGAGMGLVNSRGTLPTKNHKYGSFDGYPEIDGYAYANKFYTRAVSCYGCPVHCGMLHKFVRHDNSHSWLRGPEYETMYALGSDLLNRDPVTLAEANELCEEYGMDTLTTGVVLAWSLEMAERGILNEPGLSLKFGDSRSILELLRKIGEREGIGDLLAEGPKRAAERISTDNIGIAMQVKNSGFAAWMPRRMKGVALAFATSNRGACHKRAPIGAEVTGQIDMDTIEGKASLVKEIQDKVNACFTMIACRFHEFVTDEEYYPRYIEAATGMKISYRDFVRLGERIWNLERLFNIGAGFSRKDDSLPERCFEPVLGENSENAVIRRDQFEEMLDQYYRVRGWNDEGIPGKKKLKELGILEYL
ncbi:MAG: aldehyde ferredoxin oxidoreductase [Spirochaetes bacterium]|nr:MAG: aldehyde ferredoxin oxidoreductase [Spirochaetota bacterium]